MNSKILTFLCGMSLLMQSMHSQAQSGVPQKKVAILEVTNSDGSVIRGDCMLIQGYLITAVRNAGYQGYARTADDIARILGEHNFQRTGMVTDDQIKKLGEMESVQYVLASEVARMSNGKLVITAKMLDVETAEVSENAAVPTTMENLEKGCLEVVGQLFGNGGGTYGSAGGNRRTEYGGFGNYGTRGGQDYVENTWGLNMKMVWVEGGSFVMGCTGEQGSDCDDDEKNTRRVNLTGYYIGMTEVTQGQWQRVMGTSVEQQRNKANPSWPLRGTGTDYPMYYVSWEEAMAFCEELSRQTGRKYTLPTEAQWEYAARGGNKNDGTKYSGSYSIDAVTWYSGNSGNNTHMVGSKRPNGLGLYDMSGNVWEWCKDWYADSYIGYQTDNPTGPSSGSDRVFRGGSWYDVARFCRVSYRGYYSPGSRGDILGFRVVCVP